MSKRRNTEPSEERKVPLWEKIPVSKEKKADFVPCAASGVGRQRGALSH